MTDKHRLNQMMFKFKYFAVVGSTIGPIHRFNYNFIKPYLNILLFLIDTSQQLV